MDPLASSGFHWMHKNQADVSSGAILVNSLDQPGRASTSVDVWGGSLPFRHRFW